MIEEKGEEIAICEARKHLSWYLKGERGSASVRFEINKCTSFDMLNEIINKYIDTLKS